LGKTGEPVFLQIGGKDEVLELGVHHFAPAAAAEDAVVTRALDVEVRPVCIVHAAAQAQRSFALADA
jgi:hypothetical protein